MELIRQAVAAIDGELDCRCGEVAGIFGDHHVRLAVITEVGSVFAELVISVDGARAKEMMAEIGHALVGIPAEVWHIMPRSEVLTFHAQVTFEQLHAADQPVYVDADDRPSHIVLVKSLPQALVSGAATRALCGLVFSPTETGERTRTRPVCVLCAVIYAVAMNVREPHA